MDSIHVNIGLFDAHCHPTDIMASIDDISFMKARCLTIMASRSQDQELVSKVAWQYPLRAREDLDETSRRYVVPSFGWHPWFSYQMYDDSAGKSNVPIDKLQHYRNVLTPTPEDDQFLESLTEPIALSRFIHDTEVRLQHHPIALVGEIGIDRAFRLPVGPFHSPCPVNDKPNIHDAKQYTPGSREGRGLTPYKVHIDHQLVVLRAQLELAARLRRPVSVHCVQGHGVIFDLFQSMWAGHERLSKRQLKRRQSVSGAHEHEADMDIDGQPRLPYPQRVCMHSFSGPVDPLRQFFHPTVPVDFYFSFSHLINFSNIGSSKAVDVVRAVPDDRILVESDYHCAGKEMDELLEKVVNRVCEIKQWTLEDGARQLRTNWERFVFGD